MFPPFFRGFLAEKQKKISIEKIRKCDEETECFEKKTAFIHLKGTFNKSGGSQVSCAFAS